MRNKDGKPSASASRVVVGLQGSGCFRKKSPVWLVLRSGGGAVLPGELSAKLVLNLERGEAEEFLQKQNGSN